MPRPVPEGLARLQVGLGLGVGLGVGVGVGVGSQKPKNPNPNPNPDPNLLDQRGRLPAGLCSPVEALGDALAAQLRATPGVRLEVSVAPGAASSSASARSKGD